MSLLLGTVSEGLRDPVEQGNTAGARLAVLLATAQSQTVMFWMLVENENLRLRLLKPLSSNVFAAKPILDWKAAEENFRKLLGHFCKCSTESDFAGRGVIRRAAGEGTLQVPTCC